MCWVAHDYYFLFLTEIFHELKSRFSNGTEWTHSFNTKLVTLLCERVSMSLHVTISGTLSFHEQVMLGAVHIHTSMALYTLRLARYSKRWKSSQTSLPRRPLPTFDLFQPSALARTCSPFKMHKRQGSAAETAETAAVPAIKPTAPMLIMRCERPKVQKSSATAQSSTMTTVKTCEVFSPAPRSDLCSTFVRARQSRAFALARVCYSLTQVYLV